MAQAAAARTARAEQLGALSPERQHLYDLLAGAASADSVVEWMTAGGSDSAPSAAEIEKFVVELLNFVRDQGKVVELRTPAKDDGRPGSAKASPQSSRIPYSTSPAGRGFSEFTLSSPVPSPARILNLETTFSATDGDEIVGGGDMIERTLSRYENDFPALGGGGPSASAPAARASGPRGSKQRRRS